MLRQEHIAKILIEQGTMNGQRVHKPTDLCPCEIGRGLCSVKFSKKWPSFWSCNISLDHSGNYQCFFLYAAWQDTYEPVVGDRDGVLERRMFGSF